MPAKQKTMYISASKQAKEASAESILSIPDHSNERRHSSKVFSIARNIRLQNNVYEYDDNKKWNIQTMFNFKNSYQKDLLLGGRQMLSENVKSFVPDEAETMFKIDKISQRLIFFCQHYDFTISEFQKINEFKIWCKMNNHHIPDRDEEILRHLYANNFDQQKTCSSFDKKVQFLENNFPIEMNADFLILLQEGICYIQGRDKNMRPLLFINIQKVLQKQLATKFLIDFSIFVVEYMIEYILIDETIENFNIIIDCQNLSILNFPYTLISEVLQALQTVYKCRVNKIFCLKAPMSFAVILSTLGINEVIKKKISLDKNELHKTVDKNQLEERYGGATPNKTDQYWPPNFPSDNYGVDQQKLHLNENKHLVENMRQTHAFGNTYFQHELRHFPKGNEGISEESERSNEKSSDYTYTPRDPTARELASITSAREKGTITHSSQASIGDEEHHATAL